MKKDKEKVSRNVIIWLSIASVLIICVLFTSFYIFLSTQKTMVEKVLDSGTISMTYTDESNSFSITNATPVTDEVGTKLDGADQYFDFTVSTEIKDSKKVQYEISVKKDEQKSNILDKNIRIYLEKQDSGSYVEASNPVAYEPLKAKSKIGTPKGSMVLATITKTEDDIDNYRLRIWLASDALVTPEVLQNYTIQINVFGRAE